MYRTIEFHDEDKYIDDFLLLPKLLYDKRTFTQNEQEERKILEEKHVLNKYFTQYKFLTYDEADRVCARCIVSVYRSPDEAYIGYFECADDSGCAEALFARAHECAARCGFSRITGPVDSGFWIKYRLKTDSFDRKPYVGEPYNKPYYKRLFEENGYTVKESWVSNIYKKLPLFYNKKTIYYDRLKNAEERNYKIVHPKPADFDSIIEIIYYLLSETFRDFVVFREISKEDFKEIFKDYRYILDYNFVSIAYIQGAPAAFSIVLPDYQNLLYGKLTLYKKIRILLKKIRSSNYISLYMGVEKQHRGLGKALSQKIIENVYIRRAGCIGALITEGKITEKYAEEQIGEKSRYVLYEKEISGSDSYIY